MFFISKLIKVVYGESGRGKRFNKFVVRANVFVRRIVKWKTNCVKKLQFLSLVLLFFAIACEKSTNKIIEPNENGLLGKWTYTEYYMSIGGPGEWHPVSLPKQTIEFKSNGTFIPCESFLKEANHFEILDSVTVKIEPAATPMGYILMRYDIKPFEGSLYLSPANPICIEGCSNKFER